MKLRISAITVLACALLLSGCVSAWMTTATGENLYFTKGTPRQEVVDVLGEPRERKTEVKKEHWSKLRGIGNPPAYFEIYDYRGKVNTVDEGGGQATVNALTLGTGEIIMIPMTAVDIATRSAGRHEIYVFYDTQDTVIRVLIDPND